MKRSHLKKKVNKISLPSEKQNYKRKQRNLVSKSSKQLKKITLKIPKIRLNLRTFGKKMHLFVE